MAMEKLDGAGKAQQAPTPTRSFGLAHLEKDNYSYQQDHDDHDDVFSAEEERENQVGSIIQIFPVSNFGPSFGHRTPRVCEKVTMVVEQRY